MENFLIYRKIYLNCKYSNSSNFGRKFSDFSKLENCPPSPLDLKIGILKGPETKISEFSKKLEKWKIFQFIGKFSSIANIPIHLITSPNLISFWNPNLIFMCKFTFDYDIAHRSSSFHPPYPSPPSYCFYWLLSRGGWGLASEQRSKA